MFLFGLNMIYKLTIKLDVKPIDANVIIFDDTITRCVSFSDICRSVYI